MLAVRASSIDAKWYTILGNAPLREVMQTALGLPKSFSSIDIDQQVSVLKTKTEAAFGSSDPAQFKEAKVMDALVRRYLLQSDIQAQASTSSPAARAQALLLR